MRTVECRQTFQVGDGIPPRGTPMLDNDDPFGDPNDR